MATDTLRVSFALEILVWQFVGHPRLRYRPRGQRKRRLPICRRALNFNRQWCQVCGCEGYKLVMERGRTHHNQSSANDQKQFVLNGLPRNAYFCQVTVVKLTSWPDSSSWDTELVLESQRIAAEMVFHSEGDGGLSKLNIGRPTSKMAEGPQGDGVPTHWDPNGPLVASTRRPTKYRTGACAYPASIFTAAGSSGHY